MILVVEMHKETHYSSLIFVPIPHYDIDMDCVHALLWILKCKACKHKIAIASQYEPNEQQA